MNKYFQESSVSKKLADFFDLDYSTSKSFRQELVSTVDYYKNINDFKLNSNKKEYAKSTENIENIKYKVIGYDEKLQNLLKEKKQKVEVFDISKELPANELFKNISDFIKQALPLKFVDNYGNVWEKINLK